MKKLQYTLGHYSMHTFLLPLFFILHNYLQYYGLVESGVALKVYFVLIILVAVFFILTNRWVANYNKSALLITIFLCTILFYGVIKDFTGQTLRLTMLSRYIILAPALGVLTIVACVSTLKMKKFEKLNLYLNLVLLIYIAIDVAALVKINRVAYSKGSLLVHKNMLDTTAIGVSLLRPDVYFLIFDCYPGSAFLRDYMHFDNSSLDDSLNKKGFHILRHSSSNYNRTAFSLASELNFEYLNGLDGSQKIAAKQYNHALLTVEHATVPELFVHEGYRLYNLSIFNIQHHAPLYEERFLSASSQNVLLHNTFFMRLHNDIFWNFSNKKYFQYLMGLFEKETAGNISGESLKKRKFNQDVVDSVIGIASAPRPDPKFVYAHLYLPHPPFFYKANGEEVKTKTALDPRSDFKKDLFLSYLRYTNGIMLRITDSILRNSNKPPVIIIQGDHGFTDFENCPDIKALHFKNYSAFYFPDGDYRSLYETMSNINTFPVISNKYFHTQIPLQKDTSIFLDY